jgi:hypothetical protein
VARLRACATSGLSTSPYPFRLRLVEGVCSGFAASRAAPRSVRCRYDDPAMTVDETPAGTLVVDLTPEEYDAYLDREVERATGVTAAEFVAAYGRGELDDSDPAVSEMLVLLRVGQNGDRAA